MASFLSFRFHEAGSPRAHRFWVGIPAIATCMKIFTVVHFAKIFVEIKTKGFFEHSPGGAGLLLESWFTERLLA